MFTTQAHAHYSFQVLHQNHDQVSLVELLQNISQKAVPVDRILNFGGETGVFGESQFFEFHAQNFELAENVQQ